jgi:hypothetical protein
LRTGYSLTKGRPRHFFAALYESELAREGFMIQLLPNPTETAWLPFHESEVTEDDILSESQNAHEKIVHFKGMHDRKICR